MATFDEYRNQYKRVQMERRNGILQLTLHTDGKTLHWGEGPHSELGKCFYDVGSDPENKAVIMTGTEDKFIARYAREGQREGVRARLCSGAKQFSLTCKTGDAHVNARNNQNVVQRAGRYS